MFYIPCSRQSNSDYHKQQVAVTIYDRSGRFY